MSLSVYHSLLSVMKLWVLMGLVVVRRGNGQQEMSNIGHIGELFIDFGRAHLHCEVTRGFWILNPLVLKTSGFRILKVKVYVFADSEAI